MLSPSSYAKWTKMGGDAFATYYVDFNRIKRHDGYVYFWRVNNRLKAGKYGTLSSNVYIQGDCKLFRHKALSGSYHKEVMGKGTGKPFTPPNKWGYPPPNTSIGTILKTICNQ
jgi:hypothetical protein